MCVCVREREREREERERGERDRQTDRQRQRETDRDRDFHAGRSTCGSATKLISKQKTPVQICTHPHNNYYS